MIAITSKGVSTLERLWAERGLPDTPAFKTWSLAYGREVAAFIQETTKYDVEDVVGVLYAMDVWSTNLEDVQWEPI